MGMEVTMRCANYTTAEEYNLIALSKDLKVNPQGFKDIRKFDDALYAAYNDGHVFFFSYGCFVSWNIEADDEKKIREIVGRFSTDPVVLQSDEFEYEYGKKQKVAQDIITLVNGDDILYQMMAVSHGLSQSMKLGYFEDRVLKRINETKHIPEELATHGRIPMSRRQISKQIGALFLDRSSVNIHSDILDTPVFFWDHPEYEELYFMTIKDQDLHARTAVLNTRLDIIRDLFQVLNDQINLRHSVFLEWIIIILISMEVLLTIFVHYFKLEW
jgi:uncharacterized Rmd1/YagE family protein